MLATTTMLAQMAPRGGQHMDWGDSGRPWGMVILMIVVAVVVVGGIVWAIVYASRASTRNANAAIASPVAAAAPGAGAAASPSPREILDLRYARGEIDTADYEERRSKLD